MTMTTDKKAFSELFKQLPEDLQAAVYAPETGEDVEAICDRNKIMEQFDYMIDGILSVYMGNLAPENFLDGLKTRLNGEGSIKQIELEINKFLIAPYKNSLDKLYKKTTETQAAPEPETQPN